MRHPLKVETPVRIRLGLPQNRRSEGVEVALPTASPGLLISVDLTFIGIGDATSIGIGDATIVLAI